MKIYCPNCSEVSELPFVPQEGQHIQCPFCNQKFSYSIKMSLSRYANKVEDGKSKDYEKPEIGEIKKTADGATQTRKIPRTLGECSDCGHSVSKRAKICPNCGAPIAGSGRTVSECYYEELLLERRNRSEKNRLVYLLLALILGTFSVHNFYRGCFLKAWQRIGLLVGVWLCWFMGIVCFSSAMVRGVGGAASALSYESGVAKASSAFSFGSFLGVVFLLGALVAGVSYLVLWVLDLCDDKDGDGKKMYIN
jgi:TM2 domain-containing membrane protein YozV